jgi:hypothetical protein
LGLSFEPPETGFATSLYYNVFGARIDDVGVFNNPDIYEQPFHSLDWTASYEIGNFSFGLSATNLLHQQVRVTQGPVTVLRAQKGVNLGLSAAFKN